MYNKSMILTSNPSLMSNLNKCDLQVYNFQHTYNENRRHGEVGQILLNFENEH